MAMAASGEPTRFLTLTVNPEYLDSPEDRRLALAAAWKVVVKRLRRRFGDREVAYLAVTEQTKQGEPHLHILLRSPYIPHQLLSAWMAELLHAPIVDIRRIRNTREVIRYIAKYFTKDPFKYGDSKRYFRSKNYDQASAPEIDADIGDGTPWKIDRRHMLDIFSEWITYGWAPRKDGEDRFRATIYDRDKALLEALNVPI